MSYTHDRELFIVQVIREGLSYDTACSLLRQATTINRLAEMACSSEAADRDRIDCPVNPCLCDRPNDGHETIPRIRLLDWQAEQRAIKAVPLGWRVVTSGDPRGYTLRIIPPSYAERNAGRPEHDLDSIGVPARASGLRF